MPCTHSLMDTEYPESRTIAGVTFRASLPAQKCRKCEELFVTSEALEAFDEQVAREIAQLGLADPKAIRFMRKAIGLAAKDFAVLLGVAPETVSRWENGERPMDRAALAVLEMLVRQNEKERASTLAWLQQSRTPHTQTLVDMGRLTVA